MDRFWLGHQYGRSEPALISYLPVKSKDEHGDSTPATLLFIWNRPQLVWAQCQLLDDLAPSALYVVADGPRPNHATDHELCQLSRNAVREFDWQIPVHFRMADENLGLRQSILSGLSWFFESETEGIILEDDIVPSNSFFAFSKSMLSRYRFDSRVASVSGTVHATGLAHWRSDYYFSRFQHVWGFGTWSRVWKDFEVFLDGLGPISEDDLQSCLSAMPPSVIRHWTKRINAEISGKRDTWTATWNYFCFQRNMLSVVPRVSLTLNVGFGPTATNSKKVPLIAGYAPELGLLPEELVHPARIEPDEMADRYVASTQWPSIPWLGRLLLAFLESLRRGFHKIGPTVPTRFLAGLLLGRTYDGGGEYLTFAQLFFRRRSMLAMRKLGYDVVSSDEAD